VPEEKPVADYTFDGRCIRKAGGLKLGEIDRTLVRGVNAAKLGEIQGRNFRDGHGKKVAEFDGKQVKDDRGKSVATLEEIRKAVDGEGGIELAAAWYFFVKSASTSSSTLR
jgi:hypothetical protein